MQKGGILIKDEFKERYSGIKITLEAFKEFLYNSVCSLLTYKSRGGILFKLELKDEFVSPYKLSRSNNPEEDVREILLKFVFISEDEKIFKMRDSKGTLLTDLNFTNLSEFENEVRIQTDIFTRSLDEKLEPICPDIIFCNKFINVDFIEQIIDVLLPNCKTPQDVNYLKYILNNRELANFQIGVIAMECLSGFVTLHDYQNSNPHKIEITDLMAMFEIARLYKLGYIHGDLNKTNLLIHPTYKYFDKMNGRVSLIDFGSTFKPSKLYTIDNHNLYKACIESLTKDAPIYDIGTAFYHDSYQWLKIKRPKNERIVNKYLFELSELREKMEQKFLQHVEESVPVIVEGIITNNDEMTGGDNQMVSLSLPSQVSPQVSPQVLKFNPELIKSVKPQKTPTIKIEEEPNVFDELDPAHILTREYIKDYIEKEHEYAEEIIKNVISLKGGKYKRKTKKNKKQKNNKTKKRIKRIKNNYL
jgi:serine/threonine protein kinase